MTVPNQPPEPKPEGGTPPADDTSGLKKALEAERQRARELEKQLKSREKDEDDARTAKEREDLEKRGEYEKLRAADMAALKKAEEQVQALVARDRKAAINRAALEAINAHDGIAKALEPHLMVALEAVGEDNKVVVSGDASKSAADLVASWRKDPEWSWAFKGTGASGAGTAPSGRSSSAKSINRSAFTQLSPIDQFAHIKAGGVVTD